MRQAEIKTDKNGWLVVWHDTSEEALRNGLLFRPLRHFGWLQSAAIEFRDYINNLLVYKDFCDYTIKGWARTYDPDVFYTYPQINRSGGRVALRRKCKEL